MQTMTSTMNKQERIAQALMNGEMLTAKQIASRFQVKNPRAVISNIRFSGVPVYTKTTKNSKGTTVTRYVTGQPTREVIAAGYRALARGITA